jgi:UDP-N-acetylglucosamine 3-dehydrogenase
MMVAMRPLKAAVLGVGEMGRSHARVYAEMENIRLVGVADPDERPATRIAGSYGTVAYTDFRELLDRERPDLVSVAVPTTRHKDVALETISAGAHVLVEKPLALTIEDGVAIIDAADRQGVKLAVGHIERFNPAVLEIKRRLGAQELGRVFQVHARRLSPFPLRVQDVGVTLDLASHDIDVMRFLVDADVERVFAETERKAHFSHEDLLSALLRFSNGVIGLLDVNWLTPTKVRQLAVLGAGGMYLADYLTQDVHWYRNNPADEGDWQTLTVFRGAWEGEMVKLHFPKREPLVAELESFVAAIRSDSAPQVSGGDGLAAIDLSRTLAESGRQHRPLAPSLSRAAAERAS